MASSANQFSFFFLFTLLSSLHLNNATREVPFFSNNKNPSLATQIPNEAGPNDPNFIPQNQNGPPYGHKTTEPQGMSSDTRLMGNSYTNPINNNYYNGGNMYNSQKQGMGSSRYYYNGGNMYNQQKQGMSDTRFLENGRYFYDLNSENYIPNNANWRVDSRYGNNGRGNYGNKENSYYEYNNNNNAMEEYQEESQAGYIP